MDEFSDQLASILASARPSGTGWLRANCPWCIERVGKRDSKMSFAYSVESGGWRCLRCGIRGFSRDAIAFVGDVQRAQLSKNALQDSEVGRPPSGFHLIDAEPVKSAQIWQHAIRFLDKRGITEEKRRRARIGICLDRNHRVYGRIIIPVFGDDGNWIGWIARASVKKHDIPYLYARGMVRAEIFYNAAAVTRETEEPLIVVEGAFDSMFVGEDAAAVLGKPSYQQMRAFLAAKRPIVHIADGDAKLESWAMVERLRAMAPEHAHRIGCVGLPGGTDPDEVDTAELRRLAQLSLNERSELHTDPLSAMVDW